MGGTELTVIDLVALLAVAALWGASFLFIRAAVPVLGPIPLIEARVVLAGLALLAVCAARRKLPRMRHRIGAFALLALLSAAAPFTLIAFAEIRLTASIAAILNSTTPMFALVISAVRERRRPSSSQLLGVVLGVVGVTVLVGFGPLRFGFALLLAAGASLLAALAYALGGVYAKVRFSDTDPLVTATGQQLGAAALLLMPTLALPPHKAPDSGVILCVLALAFACTSLGFVLFYRLVNSIGSTGALTVTFLVPVFSVAWSALFLSENPGPGTLGGLVIILAAVFLITKPPLPSWPPTSAALMQVARRTQRRGH
jgi:drug/metabolite transporter (DMT)-like permease